MNASINQYSQGHWADLGGLWVRQGFVWGAATYRCSCPVVKPSTSSRLTWVPLSEWSLHWPVFDVLILPNCPNVTKLQTWQHGPCSCLQARFQLPILVTTDALCAPREYRLAPSKSPWRKNCVDGYQDRSVRRAGSHSVYCWELKWNSTSHQRYKNMCPDEWQRIPEGLPYLIRGGLLVRHFDSAWDFMTDWLIFKTWHNAYYCTYICTFHINKWDYSWVANCRLQSHWQVGVNQWETIKHYPIENVIVV